MFYLTSTSLSGALSAQARNSDSERTDSLSKVGSQRVQLGFEPRSDMIFVTVTLQELSKSPTKTNPTAPLFPGGPWVRGQTSMLLEDQVSCAHLLQQGRVLKPSGEFGSTLG